MNFPWHIPWKTLTFLMTCFGFEVPCTRATLPEYHISDLALSLNLVMWLHKTWQWYFSDLAMFSTDPVWKCQKVSHTLVHPHDILLHPLEGFKDFIALFSLLRINMFKSSYAKSSYSDPRVYKGTSVHKGCTQANHTQETLKRTQVKAALCSDMPLPARLIAHHTTNIARWGTFSWDV